MKKDTKYVKRYDIKKVRPNPRNPRKNDGAVAGVVASIQEFGFTEPIVIDAKGIILAGHTRYKAAKRLKMKTVPVVIVPLQGAEAVKYAIADNKTGEKAEWDKDELAALLHDYEIEELPGMGKDEIVDLLNEASEPETPTDPDPEKYVEVKFLFSPDEYDLKRDDITKAEKVLGREAVVKRRG